MKKQINANMGKFLETFSPAYSTRAKARLAKLFVVARAWAFWGWPLRRQTKIRSQPDLRPCRPSNARHGQDEVWRRYEAQAPD